jgi:hypothetical protein
MASFVREKMSTWQRLCLQLSLAIGIGGGILGPSELIGAQNTAHEAAQADAKQVAYSRIAGQLTLYNRTLLTGEIQPAARDGYLRPTEIFAAPPEDNAADVAHEASSQRDLGSLITTIGLIGMMSAVCCIPGVRRRTISDALTAERANDLILDEVRATAYDLRGLGYIESDAEPEEVIANLPAPEPALYAASSYYELHPDVLPDYAEPPANFHPIHSLRTWLAERRERIAQQMSPEAVRYNPFQLPLNSIESIQFET